MNKGKFLLQESYVELLVKMEAVFSASVMEEFTKDFYPYEASELELVDKGIKGQTMYYKVRTLRKEAHDYLKGVDAPAGEMEHLEDGVSLYHTELSTLTFMWDDDGKSDTLINVYYEDRDHTQWYLLDVISTQIEIPE